MSDQQPVSPPCAPVGAVVGRIVRFTVSRDFESDAPRTETGHLIGVTPTHGTFEVIRMGLLDAGLQERVLPWDKLVFETVEGHGLGGLYVQYFVESRYLSGGRVRTLYNLARARERRNRDLLKNCLWRTGEEEAGFPQAFDLVCHNAMDAFKSRPENAPPFDWASAFNWRPSARGDEAAELQESILGRLEHDPHRFAALAVAHLDEVESDVMGLYRSSAMLVVYAWRLLRDRLLEEEVGAKTRDLALRVLEHALKLDTRAFKRLPLFWATHEPFPGTEEAHRLCTKGWVGGALAEAGWRQILNLYLRPGPELEAARPAFAALNISEEGLRGQMLYGWIHEPSWGLQLFAKPDGLAVEREDCFTQEERPQAFRLLLERLNGDPSPFASRSRFWGYWKDFSEEERRELKAILVTKLAADPAFCEAVRKLGGLLPDEILPLLGTATDAPASDH